MSTFRPSASAVLAALCIALSLAFAPEGSGATPRSSASADPERLAELSLEELMNESVTSVLRKQSTLRESPTAIGVVTAEDIARLGISSLPEALRLVPGMNVGRVNSSSWAVSSRGFFQQFANDLLVLIDGRSVYTPSFGGVYWGVQDFMLEDVAQIEVIRGPGATLWSCNAVNGVINVDTKTAQETQGTLVTATTGSEERAGVNVRHGGRLAADVYYRAYVKYFERSPMVDAMGLDASDRWRMLRGGFRLDRRRPDTEATLQGELYRGTSMEPRTELRLSPPYFERYVSEIRDRGGHLLARWTRRFSPRSDLTIQGYVDRFEHHVGIGPNSERRTTVDLDLLQNIALGARHEVTWGAGYRTSSDRLGSTFELSIDPASRRSEIASAFVQDEVGFLQRRLRLTAGIKAEHNEYTSFELQENVRLAWVPSDRQTWWMAVSRANRMPTRVEDGMRYNMRVAEPAPGGPPILVAVFGNEQLKSEELLAYEIGFRYEPTPGLSFDLAAYHHFYDDLVGDAPNPSRIVLGATPYELLSYTFDNNQKGNTQGAELSVHWRPLESWRLVATATVLDMRLRPDPTEEGQSPRQQYHLRSYYDFSCGVQLNAAAYYVAALSDYRIPSYVRLDAGLVWRPRPELELGLWGYNLTDPAHAEVAPLLRSYTRVSVPRSMQGRIVWRF